MTGGKIDGVDDAVIAEALAEWPSPVRSSGSWDAAAERLLARIHDPASKASLTAPAWQEAAAAILEAEAPASTEGFDAGWDSEPDESAPVESVQTGPVMGPPRLGDDELFAAPLPLESEEPEEHVPLLDLPERRSGSVSPPMAGRSDTDLASLAVESERAPPSVEFAPTEPALVASTPVQDPAPVIEEVPVSTLRASTRPPPVALDPPVVLDPSPAQVAQAASVTPPPMAAIDPLPPPSKRSPRQRAAFLGGLGVMAAAACVFALVKTRAPEPTAAAPNVASASVAAEPAPAPPVVEPPAAESPSEAPAPEPVAQQQAPSHSEKKSASRPVASSKKAVANTKGAKKEPTPVASDPLMRVAAAPTDSTGAIPQKPSNGAVQSAMSSVLPRARACLRGDEGVSRVTLTFDSTGKVQSSSLAGPAAKKPAEACIKAALSRMKLPPFAEPKFSAIVTVRPP